MSQRKAEEIVFEIEDLRRYIFEFLRTRKDATMCELCDDALLWDKKIKDYVIIGKQFFNILPPLNLWRKKSPSSKNSLAIELSAVTYILALGYFSICLLATIVKLFSIILSKSFT